MNLGVIYLKTFFAITACCIVVIVLLAVIVRRYRRFHFGLLVASVCFGGFGSVFIANALFHRPAFVRWHQAQNIWVPQSNCLTYDPDFGRLFASYSMTESDFRDWVANYPIPMALHGDSLLTLDSDRLGFSNPSLSFATESAPNGNQLRVYWVDGIMYLSYNVM